MATHAPHLDPLRTPALLDPVVHGYLLIEDGVVECNERFSGMLGKRREDVIGRSVLDLSPTHQVDGALSAERWMRRWQAARAGLPQWFHWQFCDAHGTRMHALVHLRTDAATACLVAHVHDLSNVREAGWIRPGSEARLQEVLDHTKAVIFVKDRDGRYVFANRELERAVKLPSERIIGHTDHEIWPPEVAERFRANDMQVLEERNATEFEVGGTVAGARRVFISFKFPLFGADGKPYAVCGIATDVTDAKRTQDALTSASLAVSSAQGATVFQELVRYLATILEVDSALIAAPDETVGPACMHVHAFFLDGDVRENFDYPITGTPCEQVLGQQFRFFPDRLREHFPHDEWFANERLESYAGFPLVDGSGAAIGLIAVMSRSPLARVEFVESVLKIFAVRAAAELERQRAEETLRRSEASYRAIFEASEDAIFIHDWETGRVVDVNRRACEIYGYTHDEWRGIGVADVSSGEHPYTAREARRWIEEAKAGKPVHVEWHRRNKDGSLHWDEVVLRPAVIAGERRVLAFTREITERKHAEQALRQAQKMEALGHLTGGIAHDFNNLLTSIMGYVVLAAEHPAAIDDERLAKYLEQAQNSCTRARDLIQQMLAFSRGRRGQPRPVALPALVTQSVKLFGPSLPSTLEIRTALDSRVPAVMLDPVHLDQVLLNLCLNARDAMSGFGAIGISVAAANGDYLCTACRRPASGAFVELCVEDDGTGIEAATLERMFEPFFTTKEVGKGSGMGLSSVHGIVHEHGGHIVVETARNRGTRFRVLFPALSEEAEPALEAQRKRPPAAPPRLAGHVLVVDDEHAVGGFMRDLLESWDLAVTVSTTGAEALALVADPASQVDLVITDQMMPRMTGLALAREIARVRPGLPVVLYTGFNEGHTRADVEAAGVRAVVMKPVDPHALFGLLKTHLPDPPALR